MKGILRSVAVLVTSTGLVAGTALQAAAFVVPPGNLTVYGKGYGHGRGMSRYGAQGAALAGLTSRQILDFYYPGTSTGTTKWYVRVWTTADTSPGIYVRPAVGLRARSLKTNTAWTLPTSKTITAWILAPYGEHQTRLSYYRSTSRTWVLWKTLAGMGQFEGRYEGSVVTMVLPNGSTATYRGRLRTADRAGTDIDTLNVLTMEYYLQGVVPKEASTTWRPAALQAQAIAARTYAASQVGSHSDYDLCDTVACQVYAATLPRSRPRITRWLPPATRSARMPGSRSSRSSAPPTVGTPRPVTSPIWSRRPIRMTAVPATGIRTRTGRRRWTAPARRPRSASARSRRSTFWRATATEPGEAGFCPWRSAARPARRPSPATNCASCSG
jgi:hypothetical protein